MYNVHVYISIRIVLFGSTSRTVAMFVLVCVIGLIMFLFDGCMHKD